VGNPHENISIRKLAQILLQTMGEYPAYAALAAKVSLVSVDAEKYYGKGYQDVALRVPRIEKARQLLGWTPATDFSAGLKKTLDYYLAAVLPA